MPKSHTLMGGKVHVYRRENSSYWQCSTYMAGKNHRTSTKQESLSLGKEFAEDWFLTLKDKDRFGLIKNEKTVEQVAKRFMEEYEVITKGERSPKWVEGHKARLRLHLLPFFGKMGLSEVTPGAVQDYRIHRTQNAASGKPPARSTLHDEVGTLRQVLKTATRYGWLQHLPDLSPPYGAQGKVVHRPWFDPTQYEKLYKATRKNAAEVSKRYKADAQDLHDMDQAYQDWEDADEEYQGQFDLFQDQVDIADQAWDDLINTLTGAGISSENVPDKPEHDDEEKPKKNYFSWKFFKKLLERFLAAYEVGKYLNDVADAYWNYDRELKTLEKLRGKAAAAHETSRKEWRRYSNLKKQHEQKCGG